MKQKSFILLIAMLLLGSAVAMAQRTKTSTAPKKVFTSVDQMPQFPGGDAALMQYLCDNLQYPAMAQENKVQGMVVVQFVVEKDGSVGEVKVVRSVDEDLDKEAVRVCKLIPKFIPGRNDGQPVRVWYTLPVTFKLPIDFNESYGEAFRDEVVVEKKVYPSNYRNPDEEIFRYVDQMPQFPGGDVALMQFISSHLQYPAMAQENNVQGKVLVQFVVEKDGSIGKVKLVRSVDKDLGKEAIRVCKTLPKFMPGRQNGQPVRVWYTLPITFKLQSDDTEEPAL